MKWIRYSAIALVCSLIITGCTTISSSSDGPAENVRYQVGNLTADIDAPLATVADATERAIDQIGYDEKSVAEDAMDAVITAQTARGEKVTFRITRITDSSSQLKIRMGKKGDSRRSVMVLEKIQANLK